MEKLTKEVLSVMSREELQDIVETLQLKLEALQKENEELKHYAEIGKKYEEHLKSEATKLIKLVDGEKSPLLKLIDRADVDTLKSLVEEYSQKAKDLYKPSAKTPQDQDELTPEALLKADLKTLLSLREKFAKEVI
ncbi:MAG: hypothetical protein D6804_06430 [Aquificota bacterium]|jgi:alanyl-tRNA synthetase|nr:MAG: hypothetical protein D6804_06430 [Aquificota bacterium]